MNVQPFSWNDYAAIVASQLIIGGIAWQMAAIENPEAAYQITRAAWENGETPTVAADMLHAVAVERAAGR